MKVNFNQPFKDFRGEPIIEDNGKPQLIKNVMSAILFGGTWLDRKPNVGLGEKVMAADLSSRVYKANEAIELTVEEAAMIKAAASSLNPGGYIQVVFLIEGK